MTFFKTLQTMREARRECTRLAGEIKVYAVEPEELPAELKEQVEVTVFDSVNAALTGAFLEILKSSIGPNYLGASFSEQLDRLDELVSRLQHLPLMESGEWNLLRLRELLGRQEIQDWERMMIGTQTLRKLLWTSPTLWMGVPTALILVVAGTVRWLFWKFALERLIVCYLAAAVTVAIAFVLDALDRWARQRLRKGTL